MFNKTDKFVKKQKKKNAVTESSIQKQWKRLMMFKGTKKDIYCFSLPEEQ